MSYESKYLKYKQKYLKLKNSQKGGASDKLLPCEIMFNTKALYLNENMVVSIAPFADISISSKVIREIQYNQDPNIFLKKNSPYGLSDFAIIINRSNMDIASMENINLSSINGNDKGGNFISSPPSNGTNGCIFAFTGASDPLRSYLSTNCIQPFVELDCSFRTGGERHIDECVSIMPYGKGKFKIELIK